MWISLPAILESLSSLTALVLPAIFLPDGLTDSNNCGEYALIRHANTMCLTLNIAVT